MGAGRVESRRTEVQSTDLKQGSRKQIMAGRNMWRRKWREECCGKWREVAGGESLPTRGTIGIEAAK